MAKIAITTTDIVQPKTEISLDSVFYSKNAIDCKFEKLEREIKRQEKINNKHRWISPSKKRR